MMMLLRGFLALLLLTGGVARAANDDPASAIAMVDKGLAFLHQNGKDALIREVNNKNPAFIQDGIYLT
ncbi:MAG: cache type 2 domain-containing protein, partial [Pseudomonadota bacterium]|nr:cache type 2 domain-containing protein [Pseudomonadota bacterium]